MSDLDLMDTNSEETITGDKEDDKLSYIIAKLLVKISLLNLFTKDIFTKPLSSWQSFHIINKLVSLGNIRI